MVSRTGKMGVAVHIAAAAYAIGMTGAQAEEADTSVSAQQQAHNAGVTLPVVVVTSTRASLVSAQAIKQRKREVVDSVVADDIGKLPDTNVTDALARVTGVQILRDRGEGSGVAIRGLTQMETLLNGREVFTAGNGRVLDFADIPSEMVAGIDVYKTSAADHIEGGVGGTIDMRTRRPFDFPGKALAGTVRTVYGDLVKQNAQQYSMLASNRWQSQDHGEIGVLLDAAYQKRAFREDWKGVGNPVSRTNIVSGQTVVVPNGINESTNVGTRERKSVNLMVEWAPQDTLKLYAEGSYSEFQTRQDTYQIYGSAPTTFVAGSPVLFPGTNDLQHITWSNMSLTTVGAARDTLDQVAQLAAGGTWTDDALTLKSDLSYTRSHNNLFYSTITLTGTAASVTQDIGPGQPSYSMGSSLGALSGFSSTGMWYAARPFDSDQTAARLDGEYRLSGSAWESLLAGARVARRHASDAPGQVTSFPSGVLTNASALTITSPYGGYLVGDPEAARNLAGARATLGITSAIPASNPLGTWDMTEDTQALYFMGKLATHEMPLDGNAGVRIVNTQGSMDGYSGPSAGPYTPINQGSNYVDYLPSANLRYRLQDGLYLRGAASKTITRQDFNQMSPSLTLNTVQLNGTAGNPNLRPIRADNYDLAIERYFNDTTSVYLTGFFKRVDGFVTTVSNAETYSGVTYQVSRPQNSNPANIRGLEAGYQQFYDFLPGWMKGLGLQANYTYVDSDTPNSVLGLNVPLQNLSPHSYNVVGMYELGEFSARLAYNWRDTFLSGVGNYAGVGALPIYTKAYGWMDASVSYRISQQLTLTLEGNNLLGTVRTSYYGVETRPQNSISNDRQLALVLAARY